jgi:hypothetical protein
LDTQNSRFPEDFFNNPSVPLYFIADAEWLITCPIINDLMRKDKCPEWILKFFLQRRLHSSIREEIELHVVLCGEADGKWPQEIKKILRESIPKEPNKLNNREDNFPNWMYTCENRIYRHYRKMRSLPNLPKWITRGYKLPRRAQDINAVLCPLQEYIYWGRHDTKIGFTEPLLHFVARTYPNAPISEKASQTATKGWLYRLETAILPETTEEELLELKNDANRYVRAAARDRLAGKDVLGYFWGEGQ